MLGSSSAAALGVVMSVCCMMGGLALNRGGMMSTRDDPQEIVKTGTSNEKMFTFGAFGNEGVVLRREYIDNLESRIEKLEDIVLRIAGRVGKVENATMGMF